MSMIGKVALAVAVLVLLTSRGAAKAQLYGLSSSTPGSLYTLNPSMGAATFLTDLSGEQQSSNVGLAFLGNTLYVSDIFNTAGTDFTFGSIDPATGAYTAINNQGGSLNWQALTANPGAGLLYTVDDDAAVPTLETVTPSGVITPLGSTGLSAFVSGLAYVNGTLFAAAQDDNLYTLDTTTGAATKVGALGITGTRFDLAYDPVSAVLYLNTGADGTASDNTLYAVNRQTGTATLIGGNGSTAGFGIDGLAFRPQDVPEPGFWGALSALVAAISTPLRYRRQAWKKRLAQSRGIAA